MFSDLDILGALDPSLLSTDLVPDYPSQDAVYTYCKKLGAELGAEYSDKHFLPLAALLTQHYPSISIDHTENGYRKWQSDKSMSESRGQYNKKILASHMRRGSEASCREPCMVILHSTASIA